MTADAIPPETRVSASFTIYPLADVMGNLATVIAESVFNLLGMFYPPRICKKANAVVTELVQNVLENIAEPRSAMTVDLAIDPEELVIQATNTVTPEQASAVRRRVEDLNATPDVRKLFAETLRARRVQRLKGGLGLMRLVSENKFRLSTAYADDKLTVRAAFALRGFE